MPKFTCVIVDDEPKANELLAEHLKELYSNIEIVGIYTQWREALQAIRKDDFDLLFIDISMPGKTGIDIVSLVPDLKCQIIFVTAHPEHALEAFEHFAAGYILKPVHTPTLVRTIDKILSRTIPSRERKTTGPVNSVIAVPNKNGLDYFHTNDILYFEAKNRYTQIVTQHSKILSSYNLGYFKEIIPEHIFYQVHRSFIVNLRYVKRYQNNGVIILSNGDHVPVSKLMRKEFLSLFSGYGGTTH